MRAKTKSTIPISRLLSGLLMAGFGLFAIIIYLYIQSSLKSDFGEIQRQDFDRRMASYATVLDNFIQVHGSLVQDLAKDALFAQSVMQPHAMQANLSDHMSRLQVLGEKVQMTLLAFDGSTIHSSMTSPQFDYSKKPWVSKMITGDITNHFSIHRSSEEYYLTFATAIKYNNHTEGVLLTEIPASTLATNYQWTGDIKHEQLQLYHDNELIISLGPELSTDRSQNTIELPQHKLMLAGHLDDSGLYLISQGILKQLVITILLLALIGILVTLFLSHRLFIGPLDSLRKATNLVAKGQFHRRKELNREADEIPSGYRLREISHLRDDISAMAETIVSREQSLIEANSTLEQRVSDRTNELEIAHDEALVASRAKSGFLATMSHEIRTPMNAVLGILGLLRDTPLDSNQKALVRTGRESGELLLAIINDILDFSKMEADKLELECTPFDLHRLFFQSIDLFKPQAEDKGLEIKLYLAQDLPNYASGDPDRIRQILINLINNAIKFTHSGQITIRTSASLNADESIQLQCEVQDTGMGIPLDQQTNLFEEFTMADQSHSRSHEGTGLGLAICRRLVSLMHGQIGLQSKPGLGSTFFFNIELNPASADEVESGSTPDELQRLPASGTRILLAEDNPANQMVIRRILEYAGLQVDMVANGHEALQAVSSLPYDVVLMDISMPLMDGMAATEAIRQLPEPAARTPIIALTAHALSGDRERFLAAGMDDYLTKPIDRAAMLHCIAQWSEVEDAKINSPQVLPTSADKGEAFVDESVLKQLARDTAPELVPELVHGYIEDARQRLRLIAEAVKDKDMKTLEFETHTLGSSAAAHGNPKLFSLARRIEHLCQESNFDNALDDASYIQDIAAKSLDDLAISVQQGYEPLPLQEPL